MPKKNGFPAPQAKIILQAIKDTHPEIQKYFHCNYGVHLQFLDSQIAEKIMLNLAKMDICCLCVHDSFIVARQFMGVLKEQMEDNFYHKFGCKPRISMK